MNSVEQICYSTYIKDTEKWEQFGKDVGGLGICDDETGEEMFVIY